MSTGATRLNLPSWSVSAPPRFRRPSLPVTDTPATTGHRLAVAVDQPPFVANGLHHLDRGQIERFDSLGYPHAADDALARTLGGHGARHELHVIFPWEIDVQKHLAWGDERLVASLIVYAYFTTVPKVAEHMDHHAGQRLVRIDDPHTATNAHGRHEDNRHLGCFSGGHGHAVD